MKQLDKLRRDMELTHCPKCGEPFDILPCSRSHKNHNDELLAACKAALALFSKNHALDRFDWGKSFLRAEDIRELNELPFQLQKAITKASQ